MVDAIVLHADIAAGPAICRRLSADGFDVRGFPTAAIDRSVGRTVAAETVAAPVGLLVNNMPAVPAAPALEMSVRSFSAALDIGLHAVFSACREAARSAVASGTELTVVNVISTLAFVGLAGRTAEACVSSSVLAVTRGLAAEWGPLGIRVTAVMVGPTASWLDETGLEGVPGVLPLGRTVDDEEVAAAVAVLAGSDAAGVTGQPLVLDGGWLADGWRRE